MKRTKILIPNTSSPKNIGDLVMLENLITILKQNYPRAEIIVHSHEPHLHDPHLAALITNNLYSWAIFEKPNFLERIYRLSLVLTQYIFIRVGIPVSLNSELAALIDAYREADVVVFAGGGYYRSQPGLTQTLNLLICILIAKFALLANAPVITGPMSFGPFAYHWQERFVARTLVNFDVVALREKISYQKLARYFNHNLVRLSDLALLTKRKAKPTAHNTIGFTIRNWLAPEKQRQLESGYIEGIYIFAKKYNLSVQPIVQVDAPKYGDMDYKITFRISCKLSMRGIRCKKIAVISSVTEAIKIYKSLNILVGMRAHSILLAATQSIPFIAVGYEHKTLGMLSNMGLRSLHIPCEQLTGKLLYTKLDATYQKKQHIQQKLEHAIDELGKRDRTTWKTICTRIIQLGAQKRGTDPAIHYEQAQAEVLAQ